LCQKKPNFKNEVFIGGLRGLQEFIVRQVFLGTGVYFL
jgi:hypothetical protein